jgi:tetratricopeptide (TPR) repeat protein
MTSRSHRLRAPMAVDQRTVGLGIVVCFWAACVFAQSKPATSFSEIGQRANQARQSGDLEQAVALYRKGVTLQPSWSEGWWNLASSLYESSQFDKAADAFRSATRLQPSNSMAWAFLGLSEYQLQRFRPALRHFLRAEKLGLGDNRELASLVRYHAALLLNRSGDFEAALGQLFGLANDGSPEVLELMGVNALRIPALPSEIPQKHELITKTGQAAWASYMGNLDESRKGFDDLVSSFPHEPGVHYAVGVSLLESDPEKALKEFQRELAISPYHVFARLQVVFLCLKQGTPEKGLDAAEQAVKLKPRLFLTHLVLGRVLLEMGQTNRAMQEFETAVRLEPRSPENHRRLAEAYRNAGKVAAAASEMAEFQKLDRGQKHDYSRAAPR